MFSVLWAINTSVWNLIGVCAKSSRSEKKHTFICCYNRAEIWIGAINNVTNIFYGYNEKGIGSEKERFNEFIEGIDEIIKTAGDVKIELEGSASTVPTKTYQNNKNLAAQRTLNAKEILKKKLIALGIDISKFTIVSENSLVQGPRYQGDYLNKSKYSKYQYIKITAF